MFALRFLKKDKFDSYDDYLQNAVPVIPDNFNFAYDVIDVLAVEEPETFRDLSQMSNAVANFLASRGLKKGDTALLFMRRRWEYWILMMAMHKLGAIPIPSTNQLKAEDIKYRIDTAGVAAIVAFDDGAVMNEIKTAIDATAATVAQNKTAVAQSHRA